MGKNDIKCCFFFVWFVLYLFIMRMYPGILLAFVYVASVAAYGTDMVVPAPGSLIQAQSFPKTFADVSFVDRMEVLSEGYDDVASEYDENGVCISGCAYVGITL